MAYSARKLITKAYYLSGLYARRFQTIDGDDMTDGLDLLNDLLADKTTDIGLIPFYQEYTFDSEIGEAVYEIPNLVTIESFTFNIQQTRFSTLKLSRKESFATSRQDGVRSLPTSWHIERTLEGANIYLYPVPDQVYGLKIWGKFGLSQIDSLDTDLSETYQQNYINYMRYKLAQFICSENQLSFLPEPTRQLAVYEKQLNYISPIDLTIIRTSTLSTGAGRYVDLPNPLFNGWVP